jgi:CO/xanthine dehydrogenase Mo-binding subunit
MLPPAFGAHLAVVEVDPSLGAARVLQVIAAQDFGGAIHPAQAAGQIEGAVTQAVSYAVMAPLGVPINDSHAGGGAWSPIPRLGAVPAIELLRIAAATRGQPEASGARRIAPKIIGPKVIGPWAVAASIAAILSALRHATGLPIRELPATPDRLRAAGRVWSKPSTVLPNSARS